MCGIVGILNNRKDEAPVQEGMIRQMLGMIRHRGPDQFGIYLDDQVGLGSARLSIIDLSSGQQPISNEDQTLWIVFNGEIFNYVELRPLLERRGHQFTTNTDTEVILHLYEDYGPECLQYLNGQFAIAIWDVQKQSLFLARDRVGIRPLFYTVVGDRLIFGSEIKAIFAAPSVPREIDLIALDQVFTYWSTISPRSFFKNVYEVPAGHYLIVSQGKLKIRNYWRLNFSEYDSIHNGNHSKKPLQDYLDEFQQLLIDATQIRLRADVPVGAYLSGGVDSSTIAAIIRNFTNNRLDTFSISFSDPDFDESNFQKRMAQHLGTDHQVIYATYADIGRVFPEVIWHTETAITRTAPAPMFLLSKLVRDHNYKVVLTGEGADEFLAGYDIFKEAKVRRFWARQPESKIRPLLLKRLHPHIKDLTSGGGAYLAAFFSERMGDLLNPEYSHSIRWKTTSRAKRFFSQHLQTLMQMKDAYDTRDIYYPPEFYQWEPLAKAQYLEITIFLSMYLLSSQGDRMGMAHSVEGRFPFLDYRVIEFSNELPPRLKLNGLAEKYILKKLAQKWLPEEIWRREKQPYRAPIHRSFFNEETPDYVDTLLSRQSLNEAGLFNSESVKQMVEKIRRFGHLSETDDMALAGILSTQLIHYHFIDNFNKNQPISDRDDLKICYGKISFKATQQGIQQ
jgi:asparagine synthase (glutamine-hydrolysing)